MTDPTSIFTQPRREFIRNTSVLAGSLLLPTWMSQAQAAEKKISTASAGNKALLEALSQAKKSNLSLDLSPHAWEAITEYNNFVEFSSSKQDVAQAANKMKMTPWSVRVSGECANPKDYTIEDLLKLAKMEERIYNQRCVEGWSRVVPWNGFSLSHLIKQAKPKSNARFVEFRTFYDIKVMPSSRFYSLNFPYIEALRLDEASHQLTTLAFGISGKALPIQSGGPVRVVVPWKYGFKSPKSIVEIKFVENQPVTAWSEAQPSEYGFYANVNPDVSHPRWSQKRERPLGKFFSSTTKKFNGHEEQVASLYAGLDLRKNY